MGVPALSLQAIYEAYREQRLDDVLSSLDDEFRFVIHAPEEVVPGGDRPRNKAETADLLRHFMDTYEFLSYDPGPIIVTGDRATAQPHVRYRHRKTGKTLDTKFRHLWHLRSGRVVGLEEHYDLPVLVAFLDSTAPDQS